MSCDDLQGLLAGLIAGDLTPAQDEFVRLHLKECPRCAAAHAGLRRTQGQLANLDGDYRPELAGRINRAIAGHRGIRSLLGLLGRGLRAAGALALVVAAVGLVLWQRGQLQRPIALPVAEPAAPLPAEPVYMLTDYGLLYVDEPGRTASLLLDVAEGARLLPGGWLLSQSDLYQLQPKDYGRMQPTASMPFPGPDTLVTFAEPTPWLVWHEVIDESQSARMHVGSLDPTTGRLADDPNPKEGRAYQILPSPDGSALYLLARVGETWFVKVIETEGATLAGAHRLTAGFGKDSALLLSPAGDRLHVVDQNRLLTIVLAQSTIALDREVADLSATAALSPAGDRILTARPKGGLALVDVGSGQIIRRNKDERYEAIVWKGPWAYGLRAGAIDLIDPVRLEVKASSMVPLGVRQILVP